MEMHRDGRNAHADGLPARSGVAHQLDRSRLRPDATRDPIFISTNNSDLRVFPAFGILDLHFIPEPNTLLLLGGGIAGLVRFGRTKRG